MNNKVHWTLPESSWLYQATLDWRFPVVVCIIYIVVVTWLSRVVLARTQVKKVESDGWTLLKLAIVAHNVALTAFSAKVFYHTAPAVFFSFFRAPSLQHWFCDTKGSMNESVLKFWTWVFFLSKYYELLDTAILLAKGRPSSFLQTYHHAGAIFSMWLLSASKAFGSWIFVVFNSFIHSFMYTYYTLTCLGYRPRWKQVMTYMQITQFLVGLPIASLYGAIPGCCPAAVSKDDLIASLLGVSGYWSKFIAMSFNIAYVSYLVVLFLDFARRSYSPVKKVNAVAVKKTGIIPRTPSPKKVKSL
jgi:hypothetical protein